MALRSGLAAQYGAKTETVVGTAVTVDQFLPLVSESMVRQISRIESNAIFPSRNVLDSSQWKSGTDISKGNIIFELYDRGIGTEFKHMFGGLVTTGAGPYTHTYTPGDLAGLTATRQIGVPDVGGTVRTKTYVGTKVQTWEIACKTNAFATLNLGIVGSTNPEVTNVALASATVPSGITPHKFTGVTITLGGSSANVKDVTLKGDNKLAEDRLFLGSAVIAEPFAMDRRDYTGTLNMEFESLTNYGLYTAGTESALVITFTTGANTCVITANVRFDGSTPVVAGRGIVQLSLPFKCVGTTDAAAITCVLTNGDATP